MIDILILIGKTSSGKTLIKEKLIEKGFAGITTYTSRPMRKGEKQDVTYHFISDKDFKQKINEGFFAEWKSYITADGVWYYGTALEDLKNGEYNSVIILTPDGYRDVVNKLSKNPIAIYIYANNTTIKKRLLKRGDNPNEAQRRLDHDNEDFKGIENEVDRIIYNNDGTNINEVVQKILDFVEDKQ